MKLKEELRGIERKYQARNQTAGEAEMIFVINNINFLAQDHRKEVIEMIKDNIKEIISDQPISRFQAKMTHALITKLTLHELGLDNIKINYKNKTENDNYGAYYRNQNKSVNFYNDHVCLPEFLTTKNTDFRYKYLATQIHTLQHEIQHAVQYKELEEITKNDSDIPIFNYIMSLQCMARILSSETESKYYNKDLNIDRLYHDNHDEFYYELDADVAGLERSIKLLSAFAPEKLDLLSKELYGYNFVELKNKKNNLIKYYKTVKWQHNTNPNNEGVNAMYKTNFIIDTVLPTLKKSERKQWMARYPSLALTHNADGSKKDLDQIEAERETKLQELLKNASDEELQEKTNNLFNLYDTAIESDAMLSFENALRHIALMDWDSNRYFTKSGREVKYYPSLIKTELKLTKEKAISLLSVLESADSKFVDGVFRKYRKIVEKTDKVNNFGQRLHPEKYNIFGELFNKIYNNKEYVKGVRENTEKQNDITARKNNAKEILAKVFPTLTPNPYNGVINENGIEIIYNSQEKLQVMQSFIKYNKDYGDSVYPNQPSEVLDAIETIYPFEVSKDDETAFAEANLPIYENCISMQKTENKEEEKEDGNTEESELE